MTGTCDERAVGNATGCRWNINVSAGHLCAINVAYPERPLLGLSRRRRRAKNVVLYYIYSSSRSSERTKRASHDDRALKGFPGPVEITLYTVSALYVHIIICDLRHYVFTFPPSHVRESRVVGTKVTLYSDTNFSVNANENLSESMSHRRLDASRSINICYDPKSVTEVVEVWNLIILLCIYECSDILLGMRIR